MTVDTHKKKMVAPIVVTVLLVLYYCFYFGILIYAVPNVWKYILGIFPVAFSGVTIYACIERIKEIREGEEDDLSQY
jgi:fatty acid desaturase